MSGGGTINDFIGLGYLPAQHHDSEYDEQCRGVLAFARRVRPEGRWEIPELEAGSGGDWVGLNLWERAGNNRLLGGWSGSWAAVVSSALSSSRSGAATTTQHRGESRFYLLPNRGQQSADHRFQEKVPQHWPTWHSLLPEGWPGTVNTGSNEHVQEDIFHPDFVGLVSSNRGATDYSTKVVDLNGDDNRVDTDHWAPLHGLISVELVNQAREDMGIVKGRYLALQMGPTGRGDLDSGGLVKIGSKLACLAKGSGGPLAVALTHPIATSPEGDGVYAGALQTEALFRQNSSGNTGPIEFHGVLGTGATLNDSPQVVIGRDGSSTLVGTAGGRVIATGAQAVQSALSTVTTTQHAAGTSPLTATQCQVLYNPAAGYQFGNEGRTGTWQIWVETPYLDDSMPLPGPGDTTRPRPPKPGDAGPDGLPDWYRRRQGMFGAAAAAGAGSILDAGAGLGIGAAGGAAGFFGLGAPSGGQSPLSGFGIPGSGQTSKRNKRRSPLGGFGIPGGGGGGSDVPSHTKHGRDLEVGPSLSQRRKRARRKRDKAREDRQKSREKALDEGWKKRHPGDEHHPLVDKWRAKRDREANREKVKAEAKKLKEDKKRLRKENRANKAKQKARDKAARAKARREQKELNRNGSSVDGKFPGKDYSGNVTVPKGVHGTSLGGSGGLYGKGEAWEVIKGQGGRDDLSYTSPNQHNFLNIGFRANAFRRGEPDVVQWGNLGGAAGIVRKAPVVGGFIAYGVNTLGGWDTFEYTDRERGYGKGTLALVPPDYDLEGFLRGEDPPVSSAPATLLIGTNLSRLEFAAPNTDGYNTDGTRIRSVGGVLTFTVLDADGSESETPRMEFDSGSLKVTGALEVTGKATIGGRLDPTTLELANRNGGATAVPAAAAGMDYDLTVDTRPLWQETNAGGDGAEHVLAYFSDVGSGGTSVLYGAAGNVGNVGSGEDTLKTYTMPASTMATNDDAVRITAWGTVSGSSKQAQIKLYFGSTILRLFSVLNAAAVTWRIDATVSRTGAATQVGCASAVVGTTVASVNTSPAETLSGAVVIKITGENVTDTTHNVAVCHAAHIEFVPKP